MRVKFHTREIEARAEPMKGGYFLRCDQPSPPKTCGRYQSLTRNCRLLRTLSPRSPTRRISGENPAVQLPVFHDCGGSFRLPILGGSRFFPHPFDRLFLSTPDCGLPIDTDRYRLPDSIGNRETPCG